MLFNITTEATVEGLMVFDGAQKIAVVTQKEHQGVFKHGVGIMEKMDRSSWSIHFTSPSLSVELVEAVLAAIPKE